PERVVVARGPSGGDNVAGDPLVASPEGAVAQRICCVERHAARSNTHPVAAGESFRKVTRQTIAVLIELRRVTPVVRRPPDEVEPGEHCSVHCRVEDHRDVEGLRLHSKQWTADIVPPKFTVTVEVHLRGRGKEVMKTDVGVESAGTRLAAVAEDGDEP